MKNNFQEKIENVAQLAQDFIKNSVNDILEIATEEEMEENEYLIYELPKINTTGKHGDALEYSIVKLEKRDGEIVVHTIGVSDDVFEDEEEFSLSEVPLDTIGFLADIVEDLREM